MIENHPQWDGFILNLSSPRYANEQVAYERVRAAWLRQVRLDQQSGTVLHNAAVFFAWPEPDYAEELLQRAINIEPKVPFHVEGLGILYAGPQFNSSNPSFAARAKSILLSSTNPLIVGGALNEFGTLRSVELTKALYERLSELAGNRNAMDVLKDLPSRSAMYTRSRCDWVPLLRKCVDR